MYVKNENDMESQRHLFSITITSSFFACSYCDWRWRDIEHTNTWILQLAEDKKIASNLIILTDYDYALFHPLVSPDFWEEKKNKLRILSKQNKKLVFSELYSTVQPYPIYNTNRPQKR